MEKVSQYLPNGAFKSSYFNTPDILGENKELRLQYNSLVTFIAYADAEGEKRNVDKLMERFNTVLATCESDIDFENFRNALFELTKIGGYATEFYNLVVSKINADGKKEALKELEETRRKTEEKKQPISTKNGDKVSSPYFEVKFNFGENSLLSSRCNSFVSFLAMADCTRDEGAIDKLKESFYKALSSCKSNDDISKLRNFLLILKEKGGYAIEFYQSISLQLSLDGKAKAEKFLKEGELEKSQIPVSKKVENGIYSPYFDVKFFSNDSKSELSINASSLSFYLAMYDIFRTEDLRQKLSVQFTKVLSCCNSEKDVLDLNHYLHKLSRKGGYAIEFKNVVADYWKEVGVVNAIQSAKKSVASNESRVEKFKNSNTDSISIDEWNSLYQSAISQFFAMNESGSYDLEQVSSLLASFNMLQAELFKFGTKVERKFIVDKNEEIERILGDLNGKYTTYEEVDRIFKAY